MENVAGEQDLALQQHFPYSRVARTVKIAFCWAHELEKV